MVAIGPLAFEGPHRIRHDFGTTKSAKDHEGGLRRTTRMSNTVTVKRGVNKLASNDNRHHAIDYIEFSVSNLEVSMRFYSEAFGWTFNDYGPTYVGIRQSDGEGECGGLCLVDCVTTGGPLVVLYSADLESSLQAVRVAGGTITKDTFAFPGGRRFQFRDPSGNELAVWSDKEHTK